jgi:hypothetical protein
VTARDWQSADPAILRKIAANFSRDLYRQANAPLLFD